MRPENSCGYERMRSTARGNSDALEQFDRLRVRIALAHLAVRAQLFDDLVADSLHG